MFLENFFQIKGSPEKNNWLFQRVHELQLTSSSKSKLKIIQIKQTMVDTWAYSCPSSLNTSSRFSRSFSFLPLLRFLPPFPEKESKLL